MRQLLASAILAIGCSAVKLTRSQVSAIRIGGARDAADDDAAPSSYPKRKIKPFDPDIAGSKPKPGPDTDIFFRKQSKVPTTCTVGLVECVNGDSIAGDGTCQEVCENMCCVGDKACDDFTGNVCKDGVSCVGDRACRYANIPMIVQGCNGTQACQSAGESGTLGKVDKSCIGESSCEDIAHYGSIKDIFESCRKQYACAGAAYVGSIEDIHYSCVGEHACAGAAYYGSIVDMVDSCLGKKSCDDAAYHGSIGDFHDSCRKQYACAGAAYYGSIEIIQASCNAKNACNAAAEDRDSTIHSGIKYCCNTDSECIRVNTTSLPDNCETIAPSKSPTPAPTAAPSKPPTNAPTAAPSKLPTNAPTAMPSSTPTKKPSHTCHSKGSKSKTSKNNPFGNGRKKIHISKGDVIDMAASMSFSTQSELVDDGSMPPTDEEE